MRRPKEMYLLRGPDGLDEILAKLRHGPLAVDTEGTGLNWFTDRVGSLNFAAGTTAVFAYRDALAPCARWLARQINEKREFVFHHAKYDMHMIRHTLGIHFPYPVHDTMLQSHLIDNRGAQKRHYYVGHGLKDLAQMYVDPDADDAEKELLKAIKDAGGKDKGDWLLAHPKYFAKYGALDPWYTLQLHLQFIERIRGWVQPEGDYPSLMKLYKLEQWLILALRDMEERGVKVRRTFLERWKLRLQKELATRRHTLDRMAGRHLNWNSAPQKRQLLYGTDDGDFGLVTDVWTKGGKKSEPAPSTGKKALLRLNHPIVPELLQYSRDSKQYSGFVKNLLARLHPDNTVHCDFNQNVDTNRMSCRNPNLQQQDRASGIRKAFRPRKGMVLRMADYSQIEMRYAAHYANELSLLDGFNNDPDFDTHYSTAQRMFGIDEPDDEYRGHGKTMNFAKLYGAGIDATTEQLMMKMKRVDALRACARLGYTPTYGESPHRALATLLHQLYRDSMPNMIRATKREENIAKHRGFVMTAYGYHRYLDEGAEYTAFNSKIQGSAAGKAKEGLVRVYREMQLTGGTVALLLQVHDEIVYESDGDPRVDRQVLECLADYKRFRCPIVADMKGSDRSWHHKEKVNLSRAA